MMNRRVMLTGFLVLCLMTAMFMAGCMSQNPGNAPSQGTTGAQLWSYSTGDSVESSPAVVNGVVYVGSDDDNVYALDAATGTQLWRYTTVDSVESSPAVVNGVVYVGSDDDNVYALDTILLISSTASYTATPNPGIALPTGTTATLQALISSLR